MDEVVEILDRAPIDGLAPARSIAPEREFLGVPFSLLAFDGVLAWAAGRKSSADFAYVATPNAQHVVHLQRGHPGFREGLSAASLLTCDSQVLRKLARFLFAIELPVTTGSDLTARLLAEVVAPDDKLCIIGATPAVADDLRARYGLRALVQHIPPMGFVHDERALADCVAFIQTHPARFIFLACGAPQSEVLGARIVRSGGAQGVGLCIGASLLFVTGALKRAPVIWQQAGLEWLFRLGQEPRRLFRRLLVGQLPVLWLALAARLSWRGNPHASRLARPSNRLAELDG